MTALLSTATRSSCRPSDLIGGLDGLNAYLFDEAAALYRNYLDDDRKPTRTDQTIVGDLPL